MQAMVLASTGRDPAAAATVRSLLRRHPDCRVTVVVGDPHAVGGDYPGATTLAARDLVIGGLRYIDVLLAGGPLLARWAAVPAALNRAGGDGPTIVLGGEWWVLGDLSDLVDAIGPSQIGLLAHDADQPAGTASHGWLDGCAVVGGDAAAVLRGWETAAVAAARSVVPSIDLDRPWQTFVTGGPAIVPLLDPTFRFTPATADAVRLDDDAVDPSVDGQPLRLARFDGFDPTAPWWYSPAADVAPRRLASDSPALARLLTAYAAELAAPGIEAPEPAPRNDVVGVAVTPALRRGFRARLDAAVGAGEVVANPYDPATVGAFLDWLRGPGERDGTGVNRAADFVWQERPDLAAAFPHVRWSDRDRFVRWLWTHGLADGLISTAVLPPAPRPAPSAGARDTDGTDGERRFGVNLVGYHHADLGLGVAVRGVGAALDAARIPWKRVSYDRTNSRTSGAGDPTDDASAPYWFNLLLVAPDQLQFFVDDIGADFLAAHYNIALWYWETDALNERQRAAFDLVDEVWGATGYLTKVFAAHTDKPVVHLPVPLEFPPAPGGPEARARLGLDDRFTFVFSFDFLSIVERKNPLDLVAAYTHAFAAGDGCRLILKSINGDLHVREAEELRAAIAGRPDIELWDRYLDGDDRLALVAEADCYVSLHRSEGLGLTMAEAMAAGTPVIATGYSGNLDFMDGDNSLLVPYEEVEIGEGSFYPADGHWAQPDLAQATHLLRTIRDDAALRARLAAAGPIALRPFTVKRVGAAISARLDSLWQ